MISVACYLNRFLGGMQLNFQKESQTKHTVQSDMFMLLRLSCFKGDQSLHYDGLTWTGNRVSCFFLRPLPGICTYDTHVPTAVQVK